MSDTALLEQILKRLEVVERLERKIDMYFSPVSSLTVDDKAEAMAAALTSGDPKKIKAAKKLAVGG